MKTDDQNFLREYHFFTAHHLTTVATVVVERMRKLRKSMKEPMARDKNILLGDELGHLLAHLHVMNYMQAEATCAILYALVNRETGILPAVLKFDLKKHAPFVDALEQGKLRLQDIGVQVPHDIAASDQGHQATEHLQKRLADLPSILRNTDVRRAYNKLKHCGIVVRCAELLSSDKMVDGIEAHSVYIPTSTSTEKKYAPHSLPLTPDDSGVPLEEKYLADITFFGKLLAGVVKHCGDENALETDGKTPPEYPCL